MVMKPGRPALILKSKDVEMKPTTKGATEDVIIQNPSGWYAMPQEHWEVIKKLLLKAGIVLDTEPVAEVVPLDKPR